MSTLTLEADYTIVSKPDYVRVTCPYCVEDVRFTFEEIDDGGSAYQGYPGSVECPECHNEFRLGVADYD